MRHPFHGVGILCASAAAVAGAASAGAAPLRIMALGDSITYGSAPEQRNAFEAGIQPGQMGFRSAEGWRTPLFQNLITRGIDVDFVGSISRSVDDDLYAGGGSPAPVWDTRVVTDPGDPRFGQPAQVTDPNDSSIKYYRTPGGTITTDPAGGANAPVYYDPDHEGHRGWRIGGFYRANHMPANPSALTGFEAITENAVNGYRLQTAAAIPRNYGNNTANNTNTGYGLNTRNRGILEHLPLIFDPTPQQFGSDTGGVETFTGTDASTLDVIMLMIGTNDVEQNEDRAGAPQRLAALIDAILTYNPTVKLLVSTVLPVSSASATQAINTFNQEVLNSYFGGMFADGVAQHVSHDNVYLLDTYGLFMNNPDYVDEYLTADGVHPGSFGRQALADFYADKLVTLVPEPGVGVLTVAGLVAIAWRRRRGA